MGSIVCCVGGFEKLLTEGFSLAVYDVGEKLNDSSGILFYILYYCRFLHYCHCKKLSILNMANVIPGCCRVETKINQFNELVNIKNIILLKSLEGAKKN